MKTSISISLLLALSAGIAHSAAPVTAQSNWSESFAVNTASPRLEIRNIWGSVEVRAGNDKEISVSVAELREAPTQELFEHSRDVLKLDVQAYPHGVSILVGERDRRWQNIDSCRNCRVNYHFLVHVPEGTDVDVSTVMDGKVDVSGVAGSVSASNVNGPVAVTGLRECGDISSVNGKVRLSYSRMPLRNCSIETINGDITLDLPPQAGLDVALELWNGRVVSQFQVDSFALPAVIEQTAEHGYAQYRISQLSGIRIGAGGPVYKIASMNGDIRIQKNQ
ncbi:MAG: hypothetical protein KJO82_15350 [Gammaproteobacteria bacterium]|nr:hypothetical protein [Gammaproteobacteria bacterium]